MPPSFPQRGQVYLIRPDATVGHEIRKQRPAVIVSNNDLNELAPTVIIMPITTGDFDYYHWINVTPPEGGLSKPSHIVTDQVRSIDRQRLHRRLGRLSPATMLEVDQALRDTFALAL